MSVMQVCDAKGPLKGKGAGGLAQWRREVEDRLDAVRRDMEALAQESTGIASRRFGLKVYAVRDGRQLRWRMTSGQHATWNVIEPQLRDVSLALAQWYRDAQELALILNHKEQAIRYELKTVIRLLETGKPRASVSYRASVGRGAGGGRPSLSGYSAGLNLPENSVSSAT